MMKQLTLFNEVGEPVKKKTTITIRFRRKNETEILTAEIKPHFVAGDYAVTGILNQCEDGKVTFIKGQYTITHVELGRGGDVWFTSKQDAIAFCKWLHANPPAYSESGRIADTESMRNAMSFHRARWHYFGTVR